VNIFIKRHGAHAGKWIYEGYKNAWEKLGFKVKFYNEIISLKNENIKNSYIMAIDHDILGSPEIEILDKSKKAFLFVQSDCIPPPWGNHPNWKTRCDKYLIEQINETNIQTWTFLKTEKYFKSWKNIIYMPLAYDNISYKTILDKNYNFDICFVGGWANNGFDEKRKIMLEVFSYFKNTNLKCGFFINKNCSHEQECKIISNSQICLNIHDAYQRELGLDTNERTFKCLGLNGALISDDVECLKELFPSLLMYSNSEQIIEKVYFHLNENKLKEIKEENKKNINDFHTYVKRVESFISG